MPTFEDVSKLETKIAEFFGSPYAVATDCCTHAIELCFRMSNVKFTSCPTQTYLSIPMTLLKINVKFTWVEQQWEKFYQFDNTNIIDAATLWERNSYIDNTLMCLSFQFKKHLSLGRGGMILCKTLEQKQMLEALSYDGRQRNNRWVDQDIKTLGYHYYMTPETACEGLKKFEEVKDLPAKVWDYTLYPNLKRLSVFAS